jgi:hypothetical protein
MSAALERVLGASSEREQQVARMLPGFAARRSIKPIEGVLDGV